MALQLHVCMPAADQLLQPPGDLHSVHCPEFTPFALFSFHLHFHLCLSVSISSHTALTLTLTHLLTLHLHTPQTHTHLHRRAERVLKLVHDVERTVERVEAGHRAAAPAAVEPGHRAAVGCARSVCFFKDYPSQCLYSRALSRALSLRLCDCVAEPHLISKNKALVEEGLCSSTRLPSLAF